MADVHGSLRSLRDGNRERLLELLRENGVLHRAELARRAGVSRTTVSTIVADLLAEGLVVEVSDHGSDEGGGRAGHAPRRRAGLTLNPRAGIALGLDFSADAAVGVLADLSHDVIAEGNRPLEAGQSWAECLDVGADLAGELMRRAGAEWSRVVGAGVGVPGPVDGDTGQVAVSSRSVLWAGVGAADLERRLGVPVVLDNTAHLGSLAEATWGAARGRRHVVYVKVAAGVSAGLVVDGRLFRGAFGATGELGHMPVDVNGPVCSCGSRGCLELYTAVPALIEAVRPMFGELTLDELLLRAETGNRACRRVLMDAGVMLGRGLAGACNLLNPELVVVGGDLTRAGDLLFAPLRDTLRQHALPIVAEHVRIVPGELGERAGALGGVAAILREAKGPGSVPLGRRL